MDDGKIEVTHVVIPGEVAFNFELTHLDKFVFWMVNSLSRGKNRKCFASNAYIAKRLNVTERWIRKSITTLVNEGYLKRKMIGENRRELHVDYRFKHERAHFITEFNTPAQKYRGVGTKVPGGRHKSAAYKYSDIKKVYKNVSRRDVAAKPPKSPLQEEGKRRRVFPLKEKRGIEAKIEKIVSHWNSLGKPFTVHKADDKSKLMRKAKKYLSELIESGVSPALIRKAISDWHAFMWEKNTILNKKFTFLGQQCLDDFFKPGRRAAAQLLAHKPSLKGMMKSPFDEARMGWDHLKEKFGKKDAYKKLTRAIHARWSEKHGNGFSTEDDCVMVAKKWVERYSHWTLAYDDLDRLFFAIDRVPASYNSTYLLTEHFWKVFVPEKLKIYEGGY